MPLTFEFKAAPVGGKRQLVVDADGAELRDGSGALKGRVRYSDIDSVRYVTTRVRRNELRRLDLETGEETFRLALNGFTGMDPNEAPLSTFYDGCEALVTAVSQRKPELEVELAESGRVRFIWFLLGLLTFLMGIGLPLAALATNVPAHKFKAALIPSAFLVFIGGGIGWSFRPGQKPPRIPISKAPNLFEILRSDG